MHILPVIGAGEWAELLACFLLLGCALALVGWALIPTRRTPPRPTTPQAAVVPRQRGRHR